MITQSRLMELLNYDAETGHFTWLACRCSRIKPGDRAGSLRDGYWKLHLDGKNYQAHRLAWLYVFGSFPKMIDHINRVPLDNRIANLRECTLAQNSGNYLISKRNKSGVRGVYWHKKHGKWYAKITTNRKSRHLGVFADVESALLAYQKAAREYFGDFMPTSTSHENTAINSI